ncbi:hypothetical protein [Amycolatopsis sp. NPDC059657]|uniref:hypothetical protein n=1 Tax=Amycolatopsis sp. NPDC059657 TaxID=3346899 RepID=UPI00366D33D3
MSSARWAGFAAAVGTALAVLAPATASAAVSGDHCVGDLGTGVTKCFATEAEAAAYHPAAKVWVELVRLYDLPGYAGPSLRLGGDVTQCTPPTADPEVAVPNLAAYHWDNRVSSFKATRQCRVKLWDGYRYAGQSTEGGRDGYLDHSENLATIGFDNRATSLKIS